MGCGVHLNKYGTLDQFNWPHYYHADQGANNNPVTCTVKHLQT